MNKKQVSELMFEIHRLNDAIRGMESRLAYQTDWLRQCAKALDAKDMREKEMAKIDRALWDQADADSLAALEKIAGLLNMLVDREWVTGRQEFHPIDNSQILDAILEWKNANEAYHAMLANRLEDIRCDIARSRADGMDLANWIKDDLRFRGISLNKPEESTHDSREWDGMQNNA